MIFSILAVVLVVAGIAAMRRRNRRYAGEGYTDSHAGEERPGSGHHGGEPHSSHGKSSHQEVNRRRKQARQAKRKRH